MPERVASSLREMTEVEAAWVGAALDAEGCVVPVNGGRHFGFSLNNTSMEFISALLRATHVGSVYLADHKARPDRKFCLQWRVMRYHDALDLARRCAAFSTKCQTLLRESVD